MKAMILSAGFGTRLMPLTENLPKALVEYKNIPMINYQIERIKKTGADEIIINAHHHHDKILSYFRENDFGIKISVIVEDEILGTGGGILNAKEYLKNEDYFLVINTDVETDFDISWMFKKFDSEKPFSMIAVQNRDSKRKLEFTDAMHLLKREDSGSEKKKLYAFNGIHIISKEIFELYQKKIFRDIFDIYFDAIINFNKVISGFDVKESTFKDLGKTENL